MHGDRLSYATTFAEALDGLVGAAPVRRDETDPGASTEGQLRRARELFQRYRDLQASGRYGEAGQTLEELGSLLESLAESPEDDT